MNTQLLLDAAAELRRLSKETAESVPDWDNNGNMADYQTWYNTRAEARMLENHAEGLECTVRNYERRQKAAS